MAFINISTTFLISVIVTAIQIRLFLVSREKIKVDAQKSAKFGSNAEASDFRKRQLKITAVASAVVFLYVTCMLPLSSLTLYIMFKGGSDKIAKIRSMLSVLAMFNTIADSFIYVIGMSDTRKLIAKRFKKAKVFIIESFRKNE